MNSQSTIELLRALQEECEENKKEIQDDVGDLCQEVFEQQKRIAQLEANEEATKHRINKLEERPTFHSPNKMGSFAKLPLINKSVKRFGSVNEIVTK